MKWHASQNHSRNSNFFSANVFFAKGHYTVQVSFVSLDLFHKVIQLTETHAKITKKLLRIIYND